MEDLQRSKRLPDRTVFGLKLGHHYSRSKKRQMNWQNGQKKVPNCKQHAATKEPTRLLTDDKDYFKVIAKAKSAATGMAIHSKERM